MPMAMTAHVVYTALDPRGPATTSRTVLSRIVRQTIGFDGLLMSDDLSMNALTGSLATRAKAALFAGCDVVLHCNGRIEEMRSVAEEAKPLEGHSLRRAEAALAHRATPAPFDAEAATARVAQLLAGAP
jgi:beta-N-acetylhexosaminidase